MPRWNPHAHLSLSIYYMNCINFVSRAVENDFAQQEALKQRASPPRTIYLTNPSLTEWHCTDAFWA